VTPVVPAAPPRFAYYGPQNPKQTETFSDDSQTAGARRPQQSERQGRKGLHNPQRQANLAGAGKMNGSK
jgi:hypothetical protein